MIINKKTNAEGTCFLFLEPEESSDSGRIARDLAKCKGVKEVHLTSGRYGFVVAVKADEKEIEGISNSIKKVGRAKLVNMAMSHFIYR